MSKHDWIKHKYLVFAGARYYAHGGIRDFIGSWDQLSIAKSEAVIAAEEFHKSPDMYWYQIIDRDTGKKIVDHDPGSPSTWD